MVSNKTVAILVPIYNRLKITKLGLSSLNESINFYKEKKGGGYSFEIVIIDDNSSDGSSDWIANNFPNFTILHGDGNLWWSGAINIGAKYSFETLGADFVLLWNDDIFCKKDYFIILETYLFDKTKIIGSFILDEKTKKPWSSMYYFNMLTGISSNSKPKSKFVKKHTLSWFTGMGTLVPYEIVKEIGYWENKSFPQYFGDTDFTLRASKNDFTLILSKELIVYNRTEFSSYIAIDFKSFFLSLSSMNTGSRYNINTRYMFYKKHCIGYFWLVTYFIYYLKYTGVTINRIIKNKIL